MQTHLKPQKNKTVSGTEAVVGIIILVALAAVAGGVFLSQSRMNRALLTAAELPSHGQPQGAVPSPAGLEKPLVTLPTGLSVMTPQETFDAQTLSDKINGKAELYLSAGFRGLRSQRYALTESPDQWIELFAYDMENSSNAFAVFSTQRREDAVTLDLTPFAYRTENGVFLVHGPYYLEIVGSDPSDEVMNAAVAAAERFVAGTSVVSGGNRESDLFPERNLDPKSITLLSSDVFGCAHLDQVYTAVYNMEGGEVTVFLSRRGDEAEAVELVDVYYRFLMENGGAALPDMAAVPGSRVVDILGGVEVIFNRGALFAGIHDAASRALAEEAAVMLARGLAEKR